MNIQKDHAAALRHLLTSVIPKEKMDSLEIDALIMYMTEVTKTEEEAIDRLSGILQKDLNRVAALQTVLQVELLKEKSSDHHERLRSIEDKIDRVNLLNELGADLKIKISSIESKIIKIDNLSEKNKSIEKRINALEDPKSPDKIKYIIIASIVAVISFVGTIISILSAFGLIKH